MAGVQFDEVEGVATRNAKPAFSLVGFLMTIGIARDKKTAEIILLMIIICVVVATVFLFRSVEKASQIVPVPPPAGFTE